MKLLPTFLKHSSDAPGSPSGGRRRRKKPRGQSDRRSWHNTISGGIWPHHHASSANASPPRTTSSKFRHNKDTHHHRGRTWHFPSPIRFSHHSSHQEQGEDFDWTDYKAGDHKEKKTLKHHEEHDDGLTISVRESAFEEFKRKSNDPKTKPPRVEEGDEEEGAVDFAISERTTTTTSLTAATTYKLAPSARKTARNVKEGGAKPVEPRSSISPIRRRRSRSSSRGRKGKLWTKLKIAVAHLFQHEPPVNVPIPVPRVRGGVLMWPCLTADEHRAKVKETLDLVRDLHGKEGLRAAGFEYRFIACAEHAAFEGNEAATAGETETTAALEKGQQDVSCQKNDIHEGLNLSENGSKGSPIISLEVEDEDLDLVEEVIQEDGGMDSQQGASGDEWEEVQSEAEVAPVSEVLDCAPEGNNGTTPCSGEHICHRCETRLFHVHSHTMVHERNRKLYVADGDMYDAIARLCQEQAQETMQDRFNYVWVTVCEGESRGNNEGGSNQSIPTKGPIRVLVNPEHPLAAAESAGKIPHERLDRFRDRPTLLISTGKGKVRAGVFSRQHLFISGMEASTAIPLIQEAQLRELNVVILDPNVHGDALGMDTTEKSLSVIFEDWEQGSDCVSPGSKDLYVLSHSQSGAHLARYLVEKSNFYLPHLRAVAFTDSTHNLQWPRKRGNHELCNFLESSACIYFRCANGERNPKAKSLQAGAEAPTDQFWRHRFGKIATYWAGTSEHSLTNWFAHRHIWDHFDKFLDYQEDVGEACSLNETGDETGPEDEKQPLTQ